jgi:hypothetical protein
MAHLAIFLDVPVMCRRQALRGFKGNCGIREEVMMKYGSAVAGVDVNDG